MIALSSANPHYVLGAFSLFFLYVLLCQLRGILNLHTTLHQHLGDDLLNEQHAFIANATSNELHAQYDEAISINDFGAMGDRVAKFSLLAKSVLANPSSDRGPLVSALKKYFPWWQPLRDTYTPWRQLPNDEENSIGIVICVGSSNLIYAMHLVLSLRNVHKSKLPIQIAYGGDHDLSFHERNSITELGSDIETLNVRDHFNEEITGLETGGWAMKPFAMLASRFRKVIVLDADAMFLRSPDDLFDTEPGLLETGTMFWHDRAFGAEFTQRHHWVKEMMGNREPSPMLNQSLFWQVGVYHEQDSAAVCMDKGRPNVFMSLLFTTWMNLKFVRDKVTYQHVHGDKETFWLASELSYSPYYFHPNYAGSIGTLKPLPENEKPSEDTGETLTELRDAPAKFTKLQSKFYLPSHLTPMDTHEVCSGQALHLDHRGRPLWFNGSLRKDKHKMGRGDLEKLKEFMRYEERLSGDLQKKTREAIKSIAQKIDIGTFTHWLPGPVSWDFHPNWSSLASGAPCLRSRADAVELDPVMKIALDDTTVEARKEDEKFYGFDKIEMTLPVEA